MALRTTFFSLFAAAALLGACEQGASHDAAIDDASPNAAANGDAEPNSAENEDAEPTNLAINDEDAPREDLRYEIAGDHAIGDPDAPVTVIEYASTTCVHCETFHQEAFDAIRENYIDTGKVRFIFRELPTAPAGIAVAGFLLASCQADDEAYFDMLSVLFNQRSALLDAARSEEGARPMFVRLAAAAGLTEAEFDACLNDEDELARIERVVQRGAGELGVSGTPTFVINGEVMRTVRTLRDFEAAVDPLLETVDD